MWKAVILNAVVLTGLLLLSHFVLPIEDWWPIAGLILIFMVVDACLFVIFREEKLRLIGEGAASAIIVFLFVFGWLDPGPSLHSAYRYAARTVKSQIADYHIEDSVDYLAKTSAPLARNS